jgi:Flp pilus assembly protein TadB
MIGKKNVVFGFLYLVFTAALGPYMLVNLFGDFTAASAEKQQQMATIAQARTDGYELDLEALSAEQIAKMNSDGLLAMSKVDNARAPIDAIKSGPHVHGNMESLLNVVAGIALCFIAVARWLKQLISWVFILGALLHSGMLYLQSFNVAWGATLLNTGIGPVLVLLGFLLIGVAAAIGWKGEPVRD